MSKERQKKSNIKQYNNSLKSNHSCHSLGDTQTWKHRSNSLVQASLVGPCPFMSDPNLQRGWSQGGVLHDVITWESPVLMGYM